MNFAFIRMWRGLLAPVGDVKNAMSKLKYEIGIATTILIVGGVLSFGLNFLACLDFLGLVMPERVAIAVSILLAAGILLWVASNHWRIKYHWLQREYLLMIWPVAQVVFAIFFNFWGASVLAQKVNTSLVQSSAPYQRNESRLSTLTDQIKANNQSISRLESMIQANNKSRENVNMDWATGQEVLETTKRENQGYKNDIDRLRRENSQLNGQIGALSGQQNDADQGQTVVIAGGFAYLFSGASAGELLFRLITLFALIVDGLLGYGLHGTFPAVIKAKKKEDSGKLEIHRPQVDYGASEHHGDDVVADTLPEYIRETQKAQNRHTYHLIDNSRDPLKKANRKKKANSGDRWEMAKWCFENTAMNDGQVAAKIKKDLGISCSRSTISKFRKEWRSGGVGASSPLSGNGSNKAGQGDIDQIEAHRKKKKWEDDSRMLEEYYESNKNASLAELADYVGRTREEIRVMLSEFTTQGNGHGNHPSFSKFAGGQ